MNSEFVNIYIDQLLKEIEDLTKQKIFSRTQLKHMEGTVSTLQTQVTNLQAEVDRLTKVSSKKKKMSDDSVDSSQQPSDSF